MIRISKTGSPFTLFTDSFLCKCLMFNIDIKRIQLRLDEFNTVLSANNKSNLFLFINVEAEQL